MRATVVFRLGVGMALTYYWIARVLAGERMGAGGHRIPLFDSAHLSGGGAAAQPQSEPLRRTQSLSAFKQTVGPLPSEQPPEPNSGSRLWGGGKPGWTAVASLDVWEESNRVMSETIFLSFGLVSFSTILFNIGAAVAIFQPTWTHGPAWDYACQTCSSTDMEAEMCMDNGRSSHLNICFLSWHIRTIINVTAVSLAIFLGAVTCFSPLRLWDRVAQEAAVASSQTWLFRVLKLHRLVILPYMVNMSLMGAYMMIELQLAPRLLLEIYGVLSLAVILLIFVPLSWWVMPRGTLGKSIMWPRGGSWNPFSTGDSGVHFKLMIVLAVTLFVCATPTSTYSWIAILLNAISRSLFILILLLAYDTPATFETLENSGQGSGFGLVADSILLRDALERHLAGRPPAKSPPVTYKASIYRMDDALAGQLSHRCLCHAMPCVDYLLCTHMPEPDAVCTITTDVSPPPVAKLLPSPPPPPPPPRPVRAKHGTYPTAVSYRWQPEERCICPGLNLNMSRWQLQELLGALKDSPCLYVWLDRISIPQDGSELQNTLLTRMMAAFASANQTLVLRSLERAGSRYHQRTW